PPKAKSTGTSAAPTTSSSEPVGSTVSDTAGAAAVAGVTKAAVMSTAIGASLSTVESDLLHAAGRTPTRLSTVRTAIAPAASGCCAASLQPRSETAYPAKVIATAAVAPVAITRRSDHAYRKPGSGPNASRI